MPHLLDLSTGRVFTEVEQPQERHLEVTLTFPVDDLSLKAETAEWRRRGFIEDMKAWAKLRGWEGVEV